MRTKLPTPTRLDRAIAVVSPKHGLDRYVARLKFHALTGGYTGGRRDRRSMQTWSTRGASADADIIPDLPTLRQRSRDLVRNIPLATAAIGRAATNVIGSGLVVQPNIDHERLGLDDAAKEAWEREAEAVFKLWAESEDADATGCQDFYGLQELAFLAVLESGDTFCVKRQLERPPNQVGLTLQFFEADQVSNPNGLRNGAEKDGAIFVDGVELDSMGRAQAYHFQKTHPGNIGGRIENSWSRVPARADNGARIVRHLFDKRRIGQTRGVPYLAPVIEALKQLGTYSEAELMAAVIGAMITVVYKGSGAGTLPPTNPTDETGARAGDKDYKMASGTVLEIEHDDDVDVPNLGRPNSAFDPFFVSIVRQIGAALEQPFEVLIQHFTASYSASRAALETAHQFYRKRRVWTARRFCQPVYEDVITEAVARGLLSAPGFFNAPLIRAAWLGAEWIGPARISIDPLKENRADEIAEDRGWKTGRTIAAERTGGNWNRINAHRRREVQTRVADGLQAPPGGPPPQAGSPAPAPDAPPLLPPPDDDEPPEDVPEDERREPT